MADRPNNFGEVLLKAIGSTAEEAPSIFNNARTRKKAESLQMLNAMMQFQDAKREDQQLKMQQAQQQQQAQVAQANMAHIQADTAKLQYEMSQPYRDWVDEQAKKADERKRLLARQQLEDQLKLYQQYNMTKTGSSNLPKPPAGAAGQQLSAAKAMDAALQGELANARTAIAAKSGAANPAALGALNVPADFNIFNMLTGQGGVNATDSANFADYQRTFTPPFIDSARGALETSHPDLYNIAAPILSGAGSAQAPATTPATVQTKITINGQEYEAPKSRAEIEKIKATKPNLYGILTKWADSVGLK